MLGLTAEPVDRTLSDLFGHQVAHDLFNALAKSSEPRRPGLFRGVRIGASSFDVACHAHAGMCLLEFEQAEIDGRSSDPMEIARALIAKTASMQDLSELYRTLPHYLRAMFAYDRVLIYEFADDGSGKVTGEARRYDLESFLGQHFPASDIPQQARELYLKNTIRIIADSNRPTSPVLPELSPSGAPLDLSFAHLRSVSPIHLEYLRNMGVSASMSLSLIVDGRLWGLIACHHYAPKALTMSQRIAAELFGDFLSLHITSTYQRMRADAMLRARSALDRIFSAMSFHHTAEGFLRQSLADFPEVVACDGVGLWMNDVWTAHGRAPPANEISSLARLTAERSNAGVWATDSIAQHQPSAATFAADAAGMLAVPLSLTKRDYLFFFRREKLQTLNWAGDPNKTYSTGPHGDRLTPRKSFALWKQTIEGHSDPWGEDDLAAANAVLFGLREVIIKQNELLDAERKKAEVRMRVLNDELNHRVKNILALIKSLVNQPSAASASIQDFVASLQGRILALANAHDQVVRSEGGGGLRQLLNAELSPYPARQIQMTGPDVGLDARAYSVMALAVHELATNAAKYGALSEPGGTLKISWRQTGDADLEIDWREEGGPRVSPPSRVGFGSVLLTRSIPFDLQGKSDIKYLATGVEAAISIPRKFLTESRAGAATTRAATPRRSGSDPLALGKVLLVEDQLVIALEAEDMLRRMGVKNILSCSTESDALEALRTGQPDCAILDVNLGATTALGVADELKRLGVPFIFATGYGDTVMIPAAMRNVPIVRKPYTSDAIINGLGRAFESSQERPKDAQS